MTDLLLRIDGKFTASLPLLIKSSLMKCVLASVLIDHCGLNNLYWAVSKIMSETLYLKKILQFRIDGICSIRVNISQYCNFSWSRNALKRL